MALVQGIETDINVRWETGVEHHPEADKIVRALADLDFKIGGDSLDISLGGDGDNGETMMYLLSIYFEARDKGVVLADLIAASRT